MTKIEVNGQALSEAEAALLIRSLKSARSLPAGTVREYAELKKRKEDPTDGAHRTLTARWDKKIIAVRWDFDKRIRRVHRKRVEKI